MESVFSGTSTKKKIMIYNSYGSEILFSLYCNFKGTDMNINIQNIFQTLLLQFFPHISVFANFFY